MKLTAMNCPNCGAALDIEDGLDTFFCKYCGHKIIIEGQSKETINAKVKIQKMAHTERMFDKVGNLVKEQRAEKIRQEEEANKESAMGDSFDSSTIWSIFRSIIF